jgi:hypothetical protein
VRFGFEQRWDAPPGDVLEVYLDEGFWSGLHGLSTTAAPRVLGIERRGDRAEVRLHWALSVELPREAARFLDPDDVAWTEVTTWDLPRRRAEVAFHPDQAAGLLRAGAEAALVAEGPSSVRSVTGELKVRIPVLGRRVESVIVEGVGAHLREEAEAVAERLGV